ncbi:MAG: hypothetical protein JSW20_14945, partial [Nitrospiraceae bacterium]
GFSVGLQQSSWQAGTSYAATLSYSTTYYWHVKAKDALGNETAYTTTWSFTTSAAPVSSGPNNPSSSVDDGSNGGTQSWISPENAGAQDNSYASRNNLQNETTYYLNATGYGFVIPVGSTINGILVEVDRYAADASAINDAEVKIVKGGVVGSQNKAAGGFWPTSDTDSYQAYGGSSDLWGETWTVADINSANFGVVLSATAGGTKTTPYVDHIRITVYYTASSNSDPDDPTNPAQYKSNGSTVISTGGYTEESSVKIEADISDPDGGDTVKLQVDIDGNGSSDCESALVANPSTNVQVSCSVTDGVSYDWQVRTVDDSSANSNWIAFAGTPDFTVDQSAPTGLSNASPGNGANDQSTAVNVVANTATDSGSGSVQYFFEVAEDSGFSVGLQQSSWQAGTSYAATLSYSTTYYWHVK